MVQPGAGLARTRDEPCLRVTTSQAPRQRSRDCCRLGFETHSILSFQHPPCMVVYGPPVKRGSGRRRLSMGRSPGSRVVAGSHLPGAGVPQWSSGRLPLTVAGSHGSGPSWYVFPRLPFHLVGLANRKPIVGECWRNTQPLTSAMWRGWRRSDRGNAGFTRTLISGCVPCDSLRLPGREGGYQC